MADAIALVRSRIRRGPLASRKPALHAVNNMVEGIDLDTIFIAMGKLHELGEIEQYWGFEADETGTGPLYIKAA